MLLYSCGRRALELAIWGLTSVVFVQSVITPFMAQSFFFDWNPAGQSYPVPVSVQCGNIHIVWERGTATGPNPVGPYYLQVYTSIYEVPIIIPVGNNLIYDWAVPFPPGTLYQICMFDKNGNTGGCQDTYTVIANTTIANSTTPTCANVTLPQTLSIDAQVINGPMSQYGWVNQCTDISITPKNGTPPYTLTIAPSLHPPSNITIQNVNESFNWTVSLSWASPFFVSVVDSAGNMWANGLLHSGEGTAAGCLAGNATNTTTASSGMKPAVVIGSGVGGLTVGLIFGSLIAAFFVKRHYKNKSNSPVHLAEPPISPGFSSLGPLTTAGLQSKYSAVPSTRSGSLQHNSAGSSNQSSLNQPTRQFGQPVGQFGQPADQFGQPPGQFGQPDGQFGQPPGQFGQPPGQFGQPPVQFGQTTGQFGQPTSQFGQPSYPVQASIQGEHGYLNSGPASHNRLPSTTTSSSTSGTQNRVYVVQNNSARAQPVTIYHEDGRQVDDLPPMYAAEASTSRGDGAHDAPGDGRSLNNGSDGGRTATTATSLQQGRRPSLSKKAANDMTYLNR